MGSETIVRVGNGWEYRHLFAVLYVKLLNVWRSLSYTSACSRLCSTKAPPPRLPRAHLRGCWGGCSEPRAPPLSTSPSPSLLSTSLLPCAVPGEGDGHTLSSGCVELGALGKKGVEPGSSFPHPHLSAGCLRGRISTGRSAMCSYFLSPVLQKGLFVY